MEQQSRREEAQVRDIERERETEVKVCTGGRGVDDWGEAGSISYAFTPAVLVFCIYETLSIPKVKDQRTESKAFSEWGAEFQGDVEPLWGLLSQVTSPSIQFHFPQSQQKLQDWTECEKAFISTTQVLAHAGISFK